MLAILLSISQKYKYDWNLISLFFSCLSVAIAVDLIVLKTPVENKGISDSEALYITIPIGIIRTPEHIITVSAYQNDVIDFFVNTPPKNFNPSDVEGFILSIFDKNVVVFQQFLKQINYKRYSYEKSLYNSSKNEDLSYEMKEMLKLLKY